MAVLLKWRKILCQDDILNLLPLLNQIYYSSSSLIIGARGLRIFIHTKHKLPFIDISFQFRLTIFLDISLQPIVL
jgi:hypothetical protein